MSWQSDWSRGSQENIRQQRSEQRSATEHPPNKKDPDIRLQKYSNPSSNDITIKSLADVISKLASECDESAVALCNAARMLQTGAQAEIRNLCKPWGVQLTAKNEAGKYSRLSGNILKGKLTSIFIEKAREHFRTKANQNQQLQHSLRTTHYVNLFGSPDPTLSDALLWAHTNARQPQVASWLEAYSQWDSAIAAGEHRHRQKRRKLCKDHNIHCTQLNLSES